MKDQGAEVLIIGSGLAGATAAHRLASHGVRVEVVESAVRTGGHARSEWFRGIPYEPNGAHIFHTTDEEVWRLATSITEFRDYEHQVLTRVEGDLLSWPIQLEELRDLSVWSTIEAELSSLPEQPNISNFETWCISIMGSTLYGMFIEGYTRKQWGRDPATLSASFAPKRVELRTDGYRGLFRDPYQGWPQLGYEALTDGLLADVDLRLGVKVVADDLAELIPAGRPVIVTSPLDDFFEAAEGDLEWRGVSLIPKYLPKSRTFQPATVVNEPSPDVPYTRTIETKHVFPELSERLGTVVCEEYPGAPAKHYPVNDSAGINTATQTRYVERLTRFDRNPLIAAGRLANYSYINMDQAMRQGLEAAHEVLQLLGHSPVV